jgi:hypothetical protein
MTAESPQRIEPARLEESSEAITDLVAELAAASATLGRALNPRTAANLAGLVRIMNTYYSNLIEGHNTGRAISNVPLPVISKAIGIVGPFEPDVHDAFLLVVDFAITEATTLIDLAFSMKITRQWPIRSRHPAVPLSRFTSPDPLAA